MAEYERLDPVSGGPARQLIVLIHGLGADGRDMIGLAQSLSPVLPDAAFLAPDGPEPCDMSPYGRQWFSLMDRRVPVMAAGAAAASGGLQALVMREAARLDVPSARVALFGFSQGMMMALAAGLRWPEPLGAILGYSGALLGTEGCVAGELPCERILLVHGDEDEIIDPAAQPRAAMELQALGVEPEVHMLGGLGHFIDDRGLDLAASFLQRSFAIKGG